MPDLTTMLDMSQLVQLFKDPQKNAAAIQALGPGMSENLQVGPDREPPSPLNSLMGGGMATSLQPSQPEAPGLGALMGSGIATSITDRAPQPEKGKFPWQDILRLGNVGLTDIANILGNPRAPVGGALYEQNKEYFRQNQLNQLQQRHDMFEQAVKQSQALPSEVLTDQRFSGLAAAKAALDKDAEDGKIDNEKSISTFLTEMARSRKDLEQLQLQTQATNAQLAQQMQEEQALAHQQEKRRQLEEITSQPERFSPEQVRQAQIQLAQLKAADFTTRKIGENELTLSGGDWARFDLQGERDRAAAEESRLDRESIERRHRESLSSNEALRKATLLSGRANQLASKLQALMGASSRQIGNQLGKDPTTGEPANPDKLYSMTLDRNKNAILNAAEQAGIKLEQLPRPSVSQGPDGRPVLGEGMAIRYLGEVYDMSDPQQSTRLLDALYQHLALGGSYQE